MTWILENHQLIAALTSMGMLVVWITYLQLFLASYRRQRKATILIRLGQGRGLDAHCLVTNMSAEPIYLHTLVARLDGPGGTMACPITELDGEDLIADADPRLRTRQGPLGSGEIRDIGTVRAILEHVRRAQGDGSGAIPSGSGTHTLQIRVIAIYGSEDLPVAAERSFDILDGEAGPRLRPRSYGAVQVRSRRERKALARDLAEETQPLV